MIEGVRIKFDHVAIAVRSIDRCYEFFNRYFPIQSRNAKTRDDQVSGSFYWQDFFLGGLAIEMIEDLPGTPGFVNRFIEQRGEGMHHMSLKVDKLAPVVESLKKDGVRVVEEQNFPDDSATAFISPRSAFGILIQFWQLPDFDGPKPGPLAGPAAHFDHVSIAVKDINRAMDFFARHFPAKVTHEPHVSRGDAALILAQMNVAGCEIEMTQSSKPGGSDDLVSRFIEQRGEGMHHISFAVEEFERTLEKLKADGVRVADARRDWRGRREFVVSPASAFGALLKVSDGMAR